MYYGRINYRNCFAHVLLVESDLDELVGESRDAAHAHRGDVGEAGDLLVAPLEFVLVQAVLGHLLEMSASN